MRRLRYLLCFCLLVQGADADPRELFERARLLAEQNQNLTGAIQLLEQVVGLARTDKALAAEAQYRQGLLYQRLGRKAEAERAFEAVVRNFSGQPDFVRLAKAKLPVRRAAPVLRTRQVWAGDEVDSFGAPSPDGRLLSFVDWSTGDLAVRNLETGEARRVTRQKTPWNASAMWSVFSPDGARLAYGAYPRTGGAEIRIVEINGSDPVAVYRRQGRHSVRVADWSPDGRYVLAEIGDGTQPRPLMLLVTVSDGSSRFLRSPDCICERMQFSRDSRYVAYDARSPGEEKGDIFLTSVYGDRVEKVVASSESHDRLIGWTPDGADLLFASDRSGPNGIWSIPVKDGAGSGSPKLIRGDANVGTPLGLTREGALYYAVPAGTQQQEVFVAGIDLVSGRVTEPPRRVSSRYGGRQTTPAWAPNGRSLAYLAESGNRLVVVSLEDGVEREVTPKLVFSIRILSWHADGRSVLIQGSGPDDRPGTYRVDVQTGDSTFLLNVNDRPAFSADMRVAYHGNGSISSAGIYAQELITGQVTTLYRPSDRSYTKNLGTAISPDGRSLAISLGPIPPAGTALAVLPVSGGEPRILVPDAQIHGGMSLNWTPDGRNILYARKSGENSELWMAPLEGGAPIRIQLHIPGGPPMIRLNADGTKVAFTVNKSGEEIWVMENFLSQ